eukprot:m.151484 g.151484  ORF g.151484 m.151484 type:complete len:263 (-) comp30762_c1_seq2:98-886(-)
MENVVSAGTALFLCIILASISTCQGICNANSFSAFRGGVQVCQCNTGYACAVCNSSTCATDGKTLDEWGCVSDGLSLKYLHYRAEARGSEMCVDTSLYCDAPSQDDDYTTFRKDCIALQKYLGAVCTSGQTCNTSSYGKYPGLTTCDNASSYGPTCVGENPDGDADALASWALALIVIGVLIFVAMTSACCVFLIYRSYCSLRNSHVVDGEIGRSLTHAQFNNPNADDDDEHVDDDGHGIGGDAVALYTIPTEEADETEADA